MPTIWDSSLERKLLLASIDPSAKPDWNVVARNMGSDFTSEGVRQKYAKLKKEALALFEEASTSTEPPKAPTPRKRKAASDSPNNTPKKTRSPKKKKISEDTTEPAPTDNAEATAETKAEGTEDVEKFIKTEDTDGDAETKEDA